jgi:exodeoxyribonuclease VII small subunit
MKKDKSSEAAAPEPRFEEALANLEKLVHKLESGEATLDEALAAYEKGVQLVKHCQALLDQAELKVQELTGLGPEGEAETKPFKA